MKVGTDGVLLGAWAPISDFKFQVSNFRILDIGTGSGLIARMLMQRCPEAEVEGIDIDEAAVEQAKENGVNAFHSSLQEWHRNSGDGLPVTGDGYDLIVSNPPYFQNSLKNPDKGRQTARHTDTLSYEELVKHSARLLKENGQLALILPAEAETEVRALAAQYDLYCSRVTRVQSKATKPAKRVMLCFSRNLEIQNSGIQEDKLILEDEKGGRSLPYQKLCQEFYL